MYKKECYGITDPNSDVSRETLNHEYVPYYSGCAYAYNLKCFT
jgi:hypothetical protein